MSIVRELSEYETAFSQIRNSKEVFVPMLRQRSNRFRRMLITRSDDGYFGRNLRRYRLFEFFASLRLCVEFLISPQNRKCAAFKLAHGASEFALKDRWVELSGNQTTQKSIFTRTPATNEESARCL